MRLNVLFSILFCINYFAANGYNSFGNDYCQYMKSVYLISLIGSCAWMFTLSMLLCIIDAAAKGLKYIYMMPLQMVITRKRSRCLLYQLGLVLCASCLYEMIRYGVPLNNRTQRAPRLFCIFI